MEVKAPPTSERKFSKADDLSKTLDISMIDPTRLQEVNTLLRRAPQRFVGEKIVNSSVDQQVVNQYYQVVSYHHPLFEKKCLHFIENPIASAPGPFVQALDPEVNEVVTSLRTGDVMNVERVRQLQNILQTYEQGLQTKELIAKRKQLQLLQDELVQQRKRIEEQKRMEEELRKKEQELEQQRKTMEIQLREQLNMWHNSFSNSKVIGSPAEHGFVQESRPMLNAKLSAEMPSVPVERSEPTSAVEDDVCLEATFAAKLIEQIQMYVDADEFTSSCECKEISLRKMKGQWSMALASKSLLEKLGRKVSSLLTNSYNSQLSCSRVTMCVLKYSGDAEYEYMLVVNGNGPCTEAALLVRNPDVFFDEDNSDLISYLKERIASGEMESLDIVPFANDCS
ncbi:hypothetical protein ANCDUO_00352 [Ancylostoma duodenale]|uniref:Uncharacterized protein n=1 Tax=Ancylostoma duodenale TaxID=51022 RepID=A0A0C2DH75_9BILA|nr:hypothetical protein ANCDUO_00352 [Ancylostoma duodenale]